MTRAAWFGSEPDVIVAARKRIALAKRRRLAAIAKGRDGETRLDPKNDSEGLQNIEQHKIGGDA